MFSCRDEVTHPFRHYKIGTVFSNENEHYLRRYSNVLWVITDLEKDSFTAKRRVYNHHQSTSIKEYNLDTHEIQKFKEFIVESKRLQKEREEKLAKIKCPLTGAQSVDFKSSEAVSVLQHEYAITTATSDQPVLGTFGAGPGVILALYDDENKIAILAHIDAVTSVDSLTQLFGSISKENTVAHLFGGDYSLKNHCLDVIELLEKNNIKIINTDIVRNSFDETSLAIDARTGTIYSPVNHDQLSKNSDLEMRLQLIGSQLKLQSSKSPIKQRYSGLENTALKEKSIVSPPSTQALEEKESKAPLTLGFLAQKQPAQQTEINCGFKPRY